MKPLTRTLMSAYLASTLFLSGCMTTQYSTKSSRIERIPPSRIKIVDRNPRTLDELISATGDYDKAFPYIQKFQRIKSSVTSSNQDYVRRQIRSLASDIEKSDVKNKYVLTNQVKNFGYYRWDKIQKKTFLEKHKVSVIGGGLALGGLLLADQQSREDDQAREDGESTGGEAVLIMLTYCAGVLLLVKLHKGKNENFYKKTYYTPYYDRTSVIETNIKGR